MGWVSCQEDNLDAKQNQRKRRLLKQKRSCSAIKIVKIAVLDEYNQWVTRKKIVKDTD